MRIPIGQPKTRANSPRSGILLVECLVYIAVFVVVMGVAYGAFYRCLVNARNLRRNAEDIERVLQAGERWRADIRATHGRPWQENRPGEQILHLPQAANEITYVSQREILWRRAPGRTPEVVLTGIRQSKMIADTRTQVAAWRWEVELKAAQKVVRLRPLFSFEAVPVGGDAQPTPATRGGTP